GGAVDGDTAGPGVGVGASASCAAAGAGSGPASGCASGSGAGARGRSKVAIGAMGSGAGPGATVWWICAASPVAGNTGDAAAARVSGVGASSRSKPGCAGPPPLSCGAAGGGAVAVSVGSPRSRAAQRGQRSGGWSVAGSVATSDWQNGQLMNMAAPIQARGDGARGRAGGGVRADS